MRILIALCFLTLIVCSCGKQVARKPVSQKSGSYIQESVQRNKQLIAEEEEYIKDLINCLLYTSPSPRDKRQSRMPSSA